MLYVHAAFAVQQKPQSTFPPLRIRNLSSLELSEPNRCECATDHFARPIRCPKMINEQEPLVAAVVVTETTVALLLEEFGVASVRELEVDRRLDLGVGRDGPGVRHRRHEPSPPTGSLP